MNTFMNSLPKGKQIMRPSASDRLNLAFQAIRHARNLCRVRSLLVHTTDGRILDVPSLRSIDRWAELVLLKGGSERASALSSVRDELYDWLEFRDVVQSPDLPTEDGSRFTFTLVEVRPGRCQSLRQCVAACFEASLATTEALGERRFNRNIAIHALPWLIHRLDEYREASRFGPVRLSLPNHVRFPNLDRVSFCSGEKEAVDLVRQGRLHALHPETDLLEAAEHLIATKMAEALEHR